MPIARADDGQGATPLGFQKLERLRLFSREIFRNQLASLQYFAHSYGFKHLEESKGVSVASSATCVLSLVATDAWKAHSTKAKSKALLKYLISQNESADLKPNNPFTLAWILDAVKALDAYCGPLDPGEISAVQKKEKILREIVRDANGGVKIDPYPASAYLTQLVIRVLRPLTGRLRKTVTDWAELARQLALIQSKSKTSDAFAVAYLLSWSGPLLPPPR